MTEPEYSSHKELVRECLIVLWQLGIPAWPQENEGPARFNNKFKEEGLKGISDLHGVLPGGKHLSVECKRKSLDRLRPEQEVFIDKINSQGGLAFMVYSASQLEQRLAMECGLHIDHEDDADKTNQTLPDQDHGQPS